MVQAVVTPPPLVSLAPDARSTAAASIARGVRRLLLSHGFASVVEITLPNGRRADIFALGPRDQILIVEIKSSFDDFRTDQKWPEYLGFCDTFAFGVAPDFPVDALPTTTGLIIADRFGAAFAREPTGTPLPANRRKSLISRMARTASVRLQQLADPDAPRQPDVGN